MSNLTHSHKHSMFNSQQNGMADNENVFGRLAINLLARERECHEQMKVYTFFMMLCQKELLRSSFYGFCHLFAVVTYSFFLSLAWCLHHLTVPPFLFHLFILCSFLLHDIFLSCSALDFRCRVWAHDARAPFYVFVSTKYFRWLCVSVDLDLLYPGNIDVENVLQSFSTILCLCFVLRKKNGTTVYSFGSFV